MGVKLEEGAKTFAASRAEISHHVKCADGPQILTLHTSHRGGVDPSSLSSV